jgi:hypothetical protein
MEPVKPNYIPHVVQPVYPVQPMPLPHPMPMPMPAPSHPIHFEHMTLTENVHLNAYAPHHHHPHHPHPVVCRPMNSGPLLVLFILLVIISRGHDGILHKK